MKKCIDCEHLNLIVDPERVCGEIYELGYALCEKHNLYTYYKDKRKFNRLVCVEDPEGEEE